MLIYVFVFLAPLAALMIAIGNRRMPRWYEALLAVALGIVLVPVVGIVIFFVRDCPFINGCQ